MAGDFNQYAATIGRGPRSHPTGTGHVAFVKYIGWAAAPPGDVVALVSEAAALPGGCPLSRAQLAVFSRANTGCEVRCCGKGWIISPPAPTKEQLQAIEDACHHAAPGGAAQKKKSGGAQSTLGAAAQAFWDALSAAGGGGAVGGYGPFGDASTTSYQRPRPADGYVPYQLDSWRVINPTGLGKPRKEPPPPPPPTIQDTFGTAACAKQGETLGSSGLAACVNEALGIAQWSQLHRTIPTPSKFCDNGEDVIGCGQHFLHLPGGTINQDFRAAQAFLDAHHCCPGSYQVYFTWAGIRINVNCGKGGAGSNCGKGDTFRSIQWDHWPTPKEVQDWSLANCARPASEITWSRGKNVKPGSKYLAPPLAQRPPYGVGSTCTVDGVVHSTTWDHWPTADEIKAWSQANCAGNPVTTRLIKPPPLAPITQPATAPIYTAPPPGPMPKPAPSGCVAFSSCIGQNVHATKCWDHMPTAQEIADWSRANCGAAQPPS